MHFKRTTANVPSHLSRLLGLGLGSCWRWIALLALAAVIQWPSSSSAQSATQHEYEIKAAYLYNFINYIDWPADALPPAGGTITIGIMGGNDFASAFEPLNGKKIKDRTLVVRQITSMKEVESCQIVFVFATEKARLTEIIGQLKDSRALTVGEFDGFAAQGGIINFISDRNKVRFEINTEAAKRLRLTISSDLLKLAKLVKS